VLLSTFNGSRYLDPLMNSLIDQDYLNIEILVRDDGSTDNTIDILKRYDAYGNVSIIEGTNVGVPHSFFRILQLSSSSSDYLAFCDQDDVWHKDKMSCAVNFLKRLPKEVPSMYCARVLIVDEQLNIIGPSSIPKHSPSFENALVENIAAGCTIVINRAARNLLLQELPKHAIMHDWWMYQVVSAFGKVIYDPDPKILYRQHSSNVMGVKIGGVAKWEERIRRFLKRRGLHLLTRQAEEFNRIYGPILSLNKKLVLDQFIGDRASFVGRLRYVLCGKAYRQSAVDNIIFKILILLDTI